MTHIWVEKIHEKTDNDAYMHILNNSHKTQWILMKFDIPLFFFGRWLRIWTWIYEIQNGGSSMADQNAKNCMNPLVLTFIQITC